MAAKLPEAPSPAELGAVARAELRSLRAALGRIKAGQSVHGARRQIKRLRSLLRLLRTTMGEEAFAAANSALREAADALAGQRRAEALALAAGRLGGGHQARAAWLHLAQAHRDAQQDAAAAGGGLVASRKAVEAAKRSLVGLRLKPGPPAIEEAFLATYRKARKRLGHGLKTGDAEELHTARKHVIHHLHHLDLLSDHLTRPAKRLKALDSLREALGDLNDLDELNNLTGEAKVTPPEPARRAMAKRRAVLLNRAGKAAERLFRLKPKAFQKRIGAMWIAAEG